MSSVDLGLGVCPLGVSAFGYGEPASSDTLKFKILPDSVRHASRDARYIDPLTKDFTIDDDGRTVGQDSISQQVYLALMTSLGSSVNFNLGNNLSSIKTFNKDNIKSQVTTQVNLALKTLINSKSISVLKILVDLSPNKVGINLQVDWRNNLNGQINSFIK